MFANPRLSIEEAEAIGWKFLASEKPPSSRYRFSSAKYFDHSHQFEPLRNTWNLYFDLNEDGTLASSVGIVVNVDDLTGVAAWPDFRRCT